MTDIYDSITDEEIVAAEKIFLPEGSFFDSHRRSVIKYMGTANINAAPGSGKTTVLLAKLFILAQRMPFKEGAGVCVITHTNVAIEEIKERLGSKSDVLFTYPNFFGTFQSFVDRYLAIPYYSLKTNSRSVIINQSYYEEKINQNINFTLKGFSRETHKNARYFLNSRRGIVNKIRLTPYKGRVVLTEGIGGKEINIKRPSRSFAKYGDFSEQEKVNINKWIIKLKFELLDDGVLCYDDAYYLAEQYINKYEDKLKEILSKRFRFVFVDESQDTYSHQSRIIDKLFNEQVVKQYFGDPNQAIFDSQGTPQESSGNIIGASQLRIPQSHRFGVSIAEKLEKVCTDQESEIEGNLIKKSLKPHIMLFNSKEINNVLESFVVLIKKYNLHLTGENNIYKAIGWRGNKTDDILNKLCLNSYLPSFNKKISESKSVYNENLMSYIKKIPNEIVSGTGIKIYFDALINGITRFLYLSNIKDPVGKRFFNKNTLLQYLKEYKTKEYHQLKVNLSEWITNIHHSEAQYNNDVYFSIKNYLLNDLKEIWPKISLSKVEKFLEEVTSEINVVNSEINNNYISPNHPEIKIKVDTVHAVKGETHKATLYLETFKDKHDLKLILPFLKGHYDKKLVAKKQINAALKVLYVGMSRPSDLLCLAMNSDDLEASDISDLQQSGWEIIFANENVSGENALDVISI